MKECLNEILKKPGMTLTCDVAQFLSWQRKIHQLHFPLKAPFIGRLMKRKCVA